MEEFTQLPHEVLKAMILGRFKSRELKILLVVVRASYGFHHHYAQLKNVDFYMTGLWPSAITTTLRQLETKRVIKIQINVREKGIAINENISEWKVYQNENVENEKITKMVNGMLSKQFNKRAVSKKIIDERPHETYHGFQPLFGPKSIKKDINLKDKEFFDQMDTLDRMKRMTR